MTLVGAWPLPTFTGTRTAPLPSGQSEQTDSAVFWPSAGRPTQITSSIRCRSSFHPHSNLTRAVRKLSGQPESTVTVRLYGGSTRITVPGTVPLPYPQNRLANLHISRLLATFILQSDDLAELLGQHGSR
jgi:hypothetical protein